MSYKTIEGSTEYVAREMGHFAGLGYRLHTYAVLNAVTVVAVMEKERDLR